MRRVAIKETEKCAALALKIDLAVQEPTVQPEPKLIEYYCSKCSEEYCTGLGPILSILSWSSYVDPSMHCFAIQKVQVFLPF